MKTLMKISFVLASILFAVNTFAQKQLTDATIVYKLAIETRNGEKQLGNGLNGAVLTISLSKDKSRTEMVSVPGVETTVFDAKAGKGFILKEFSAQKLMITTTADNWAQKNQNIKKQVFTTDESSTTIAGYKCKKAVTANADGKNYTVYYDPTVTMANTSYNNAFPQIAGLPVQFELSSGNLVFKYTLSTYTSDAIPAAKFDAPKSGFRVMTYEENQQLKKGE
jgi:hypothetical protein